MNVIVQDRGRTTLCTIENAEFVPRIGERIAFADIVYQVDMVIHDVWRPKNYLQHKVQRVIVVVQPI